MSDQAAPTSATGGSAASQADSLDNRAWTPHPWLSRAIRTLILVIPLAVGFAAVSVATRFTSRPGEPLLFAVWLGFLVAVSTAAAYATQRLTRRLAPLSTLFRMSLVFPDEAPSRFKAALRAGSGGSLARRLDRTSSDSSPEQAAAEELIVLLAQLNAHDRLTRGHSERVRAFSVMLGEEIELTPDDLDKLNWAALIHDIGKLEVPEAILNKPGRPTDAEWQVLRGHPGAAADYIEPLRPWLGDWVDAATQHHERYDGGGYPSGLTGDQISLAGRIVSIGDAYDVMTATRSYKQPLPAAQARAELLRNAGTQFDPQLVRSFLQISLGRMRWIIGPMGWLSHLPDLLRAPLTTVASTSSGLVAAGAITIAATTAAATPPPTVLESAAVAERTVTAEPVEPDTTGSSTPDAPKIVEAATPIAAADDESSGRAGPAPTATTSLPSPSTTDSPVASTTTTAPATSTSTTTTTATTTTSTTTTSTTTTTTPPPPPPGWAVDDAQTGTNEANFTVWVLDNDEPTAAFDYETLTVVVQGTNGTATEFIPGGQPSNARVNYGADDGFVGSDTFVYEICDVEGSCASATVTLTIVAG